MWPPKYCSLASCRCDTLRAANKATQNDIGTDFLFRSTSDLTRWLACSFACATPWTAQLDKTISSSSCESTLQNVDCQMFSETFARACAFAFKFFCENSQFFSRIIVQTHFFCPPAPNNFSCTTVSLSTRTAAVGLACLCSSSCPMRCPRPVVLVASSPLPHTLSLGIECHKTCVACSFGAVRSGRVFRR